MNIIMVGGGKLVYFLAKTLIGKGHVLTIINRDEDECHHLARALRATVVLGDASDVEVLEDAGAGSADAVLAITPNDPDNLIICQLASLRFLAPRVLALANDPDNEGVFERLGVPATSTTRVLANLIEQEAAFEDVLNLIPVAEGKVNLTQVTLADDSPVIGHALKDIPLPQQSLVAILLRNDEVIIPRGSTVFASGDRAVVVTMPANHGEVLRMLTAEE